MTPSPRTLERPDGRPSGWPGLPLGVLAFGTACLLGVLPPGWLGSAGGLVVWILAGVLAVRGPRGLRQLAVGGFLALALLLLTVLYTPLAPRLMRSVVIDDGPAPADAIVVLSAANFARSLGAKSLDRVVAGWQLLEQGYAPKIVFTGDPRSSENTVHLMAPATLRALGLDTAAVVPFEGVAISPMNTYGEALSLAAMARKYHWRRLLVVTSASHTRRSKAVFESAGLQVRTVAAPGAIYEWPDVGRRSARVAMFRDWVYETAALAKYRALGRL